MFPIYLHNDEIIVHDSKRKNQTKINDVTIFYHKERFISILYSSYKISTSIILYKNPYFELKKKNVTRTSNRKRSPTRPTFCKSNTIPNSQHFHLKLNTTFRKSKKIESQWPLNPLPSAFEVGGEGDGSLSIERVLGPESVVHVGWP